MDKSILNHLFLPFELPSSEDDDYLLQNGHHNEYKLLELMIEYFNSLDSESVLPIFRTVSYCIQRWSKIQNTRMCTPANLQLAIDQLKPGHFLPLYFHAQNAAILIEINERAPGKPLISSWQVALPTETITSSIQRHFSYFPVPTFRLLNRAQLTSRTHLELLADFMNDPIEYSRTFKAARAVNEIRDVPNAHYVCQWWVMHFPGVKVEENSPPCSRFKKKHRDHVRWRNTLLPFRRSGLWMTIKVVIYTILAKRLGIIGNIVYKLLITSFLTHVVCTRNASPDLMVHCVRKITRRLNKIDTLLSSMQSTDINEWIHYTKRNINMKMEGLFPKPDEPNCIEMNEETQHTWQTLRSQLSDVSTNAHLCTDLKMYLRDCAPKESFNALLFVSASNRSLLGTTHDFDQIPSMELLINQSKYSIGIVLTCVEIWIESRLKQWLNRPLTPKVHKHHFELLLNLFEQYHSKALNHYCPDSAATDYAGYSRYILTSLTLIQHMHAKLCLDRRFGRLKFHAIDMVHVLNLFEYLTLPNREDMIRGRRLYDYFRQFKNKPYPDLLKDIDAEEAFGVHFAHCSASMNDILAQIRSESERDREAKIQEVENARARYQQLMDQVNLLQCECSTYRYQRMCERCSLVDRANEIRVQIFECPIPSDHSGALAVVFELQTPVEIRCFREIVWQFINRRSSCSQNTMFEWLKVPPHADKLTKFYSGSVTHKVKLVSSTKSITQTHYATPPSFMSTPIEDFLCENSLKVQLSPTRSIEFQEECDILTPQLDHPGYTHLQLALKNTEFVQNRVIANLSECPQWMRPMQHVEFGSFRSGHRLQWWNLLSVLEMQSIAIGEESVAILITHALCQYGPVTTDINSLVCAWCPESHEELLEDHFVDTLISKLNQRLIDCQGNWQNELVLVVFVIIALRILSICNSTRRSHVIQLILRCRQLGEIWIDRISECIQTVSTADMNSLASLRNKKVTISFACVFTFSIDSNLLRYLLSSTGDVVSLLKAITNIRDSVILNKTHSNISDFVTHMMRMSERVLTKMQPHMAEYLANTSYQSLNDFSTMYWAVMRSQGTMTESWRKRKPDLYDGWYDGRYGSAVISIDCLTGTFLVNGMTIGYLPEQITSNPLFIRVFGDHVFEVQATEFSQTYITKQSYHGSRRVRYDFHFDTQSERLTIREDHTETNEQYELIPQTCFTNDLPDAFISNHSHWRHVKTGHIVFRPVRFAAEDFLTNESYYFNSKTGFIRTPNRDVTRRVLVNQSSEFFITLFTQFFSRLDDKPYVYMMSETQRTTTHGAAQSRENAVVYIHLSRLGLVFTYDSRTTVIVSREYPDMCIDENQWLGTLSGLQSGLLLSPCSAVEKQCERYKCKILIVPFGVAIAHREHDESHHSVTIERVPESTGFLDQYFVFTLNDRLRILQSAVSPSGWLYLALLHAITSHVLTDEYTGMTGMERSFQLLNSPGCSTDQPYDMLSLEILLQIASISPKVNYYPRHLMCMEKVEWKSHHVPYSMQHFGYYLIAKKLIKFSQELSFMYPSSTDGEARKFFESDRYNENLLKKLYWDYRDSYNPLARLPSQMEAEIQCESAEEPYSLNDEHFSDATDHTSVNLMNDLYANGDVDLKDSPRLSCFPLSKWLSHEYSLKNSWIGLLKCAGQLRFGGLDSSEMDIERFEMLLDFLNYLSRKQPTQPFYLQMLRTTLRMPGISLDSVPFPAFVQYENIDEIIIQPARIHLPKKIGSTKRPEALKEIAECFDKDSLYVNRTYPERGIDKVEINRLLKSWRLNSKLRSFLWHIQSRFLSIHVIPLDVKTSVDPQQFGLELFQDHYRIQTMRVNRSVNRTLYKFAERRFFHLHKCFPVGAMPVIRSHEDGRAFPSNIFPSLNPNTNPLNEIAQHFKDQLSASWHKLLSDEEHRTEYPRTNRTKRFLNYCRRKATEIWHELVNSIVSSNEMLYATGLLARIVPVTLICVLQQIWLKQYYDPSRSGSPLSGSSFEEIQSDETLLLPIMTVEQYTLLGGAMVIWVMEQQIERALSASIQGKQEDFEKEMSNVPHVNWIPCENVPWLILELEMNITIRKTQIDVANHMMQIEATEGHLLSQSLVMQMNMGEGKTSVILPMLALSLSSRYSSLVRIIVLKSLFSINHQSLRCKLGGLLNRSVMPFACRRDMNFNVAQVNQIFNRLKRGLSNGDVLITSPEDILSFDLLTIDKCRRKEFDAGRAMLSLQRWLKEFARDVLDESDEILHVKYQLIYTVDSQQQVDGGMERWKTIQAVLHLIKNNAAQIAEQFSEHVSYRPSQQPSRYPRFRLLTNQPFRCLCEQVARDWLHEQHYRQVDESTILKFILETDSSVERLNDVFSPNDIQRLLILRGLLSCEVLLVAFKKRYRVQFGINRDPSFHRLMAVPFRAKDVAAERTEFGHVDVAIVLTQLSYFYSGLSDTQMLECLRRLNEEEHDPRSIYDEWISYEKSVEIHPSIRQWTGVNPKDYHQRTHYLFPMLRYNTSVINYFLNHFVFPREAKQFPNRLVSSPWDLSSPARSKIITGFSGTNDTKLLLPIHIRQRDLPELEKTDAVVINNLLRSENESYQDLPSSATTSDILKRIVDSEPDVQVILDVGALFDDKTNQAIAIEWLNISDVCKIDYAIYLESDSIIACDRQLHKCPFQTSPAIERLDRCVVYLDEIHTRGTDFKFPTPFRAAVTLGSGLTKDRLVQACMRMRKLGHGHSLSFWSSHEVHREIQTLKGDRQRSLDHHIFLEDILRWVYENTQQATWHGLYHWAIQSLSYQKKLAAFENIQWQNREQPFTDMMMQKLARGCLEPEIIDLKKMYGGPKEMQVLCGIYMNLYTTLRFQTSAEIHQEIHRQLRKYGGSRRRLAQLLDQEQERELEQELEEERQCIRPPVVTPCEPILHETIKKLCNTPSQKMELNQRTPEILRMPQAFRNTTFFGECQPHSWKDFLWISSEFQRVIATEGESLDPFLRPPRWVVVYQGKHLIFVSAFEANWIMGTLKRLHRQLPPTCSKNTTLRLFLPRMKQDQLILINTPALTIPPFIKPTTNPLFITVSKDQLAALFLFNGTLYFDSADEQIAYCQLLGLCPKPRTYVEEHAFQKGWITPDGFVATQKRCLLSNVAQCKFTSNPLQFVKKLLENRHNAHAPVKSHVGSLIFNASKLL